MPRRRDLLVFRQGLLVDVVDWQPCFLEGLAFQEVDESGVVVDEAA